MNRLLLIVALTLAPGCQSIRASVSGAQQVTNAIFSDISAAIEGISDQDQEDRP